MNAGADVISWSGGAAAWISLVGEAAAKGTLLLLAAFLFTFVLRRGSAASRHLVWAFCLSLLLLLPVLAQVAPTIAAPVIPPTWSAAWSDVVDAASSGLAAWFGGEHVVYQPSAWVDLATPLDLDRAIALEGATVHLESITVDNSRQWAASTWLAAIWTTGVALVLAWLAVGLWLRRSLSRRARVVTKGPWVEATQRIAAQLGIRRELVVLCGEEDAVPMTWGGLRPLIYLPAVAAGWPAEQIRSVLMHELAHVRRWDSLTRSVSQLACAVFWFHPLAWYAAHRLLREQERACDDVVLLAGAEPDEYATTLLTLARQYRRRRPALVGALAFARRTTLENRLISILDPRRKRITMSRTHRVVLLATFVAVAFPLASLQPAPAAAIIISNQSSVAVESGDAASGQEGAGTTATTQEKTPVQMIIKGRVHLGSSLDEIEVEPGGRFVIQEIQRVDDHLELDSADPAEGRRLEISADDEGDVERVWTVDGTTRALDDDARGWINGILGRLDDAHVEFSPGGADEARTLIFAGESLAMVGEAHASAGASSHGAVFVSEGDRVIHIKPGMVWTTEEGDEQETIDIHLAEAVVTEGGTTIHLNLAKPLVSGEGREWSIYISDPELLRHKHELRDSIVVELEKIEGGKSFTIVAPELEVLQEGDERKVVVIRPNVEIVEEGGEEHAFVVVKPHVVLETEALAEAMADHNVRIAITEAIEEEPLTVVMERAGDERHRHGVRIRTRTENGGSIDLSTRGEVELGETVEEIEIGEGGELVIDARDADGVIRQLSVRQGTDGNLLFEFHVDGEERPFDVAARAWLQGVLDRVKS